MPIIVAPGDPLAPLTQGDLLKDVPLFVSGALDTDAPSAVLHKVAYCLVMSRPCVALNKERVVVAAVERTKERPQLKTFNEAGTYFENLRDGKSRPDMFYLGQLPNETGSFSARLDSLHTIELPTGAARQPFVSAARVARLDAAFARDLHQRLFRAFASLGFDDHSWYSTDDLQVLVALGVAARGALESAYQTANAAALTGASQAYNNPKEKQGLESAAASAKKALDTLDAELAPLRAELNRRTA
jgi:hypothetical protein